MSRKLEQDAAHYYEKNSDSVKVVAKDMYSLLVSLSLSLSLSLHDHIHWTYRLGVAPSGPLQLDDMRPQLS